MLSPRTRLDRFFSAELGISRKELRIMLARGRITVDKKLATAMNQVVHQFSHIQLDDTVLRASHPVHLVMNKPTGVVSATRDKKLKTVIDLLDRTDRESLHIVGRLDFNSSGLLLLTNDGRWSRKLSAPEHKVSKVYRVSLKNPVSEACVAAFAQGIYFPFEGITTRPATIRIIADTKAQTIVEVSLTEGRYHQIKRMFGRFRNPVLTLHRIAVGALYLDHSLAPGQSRDLTEQEWRSIDVKQSG